MSGQENGPVAGCVWHKNLSYLETRNVIIGSNMAKNRKAENFDIVFSGPNKIAKGWAFSVSEAFTDHLDLSMSEIGFKLSWVQKDPPCYRFDVGAMFFDPPDARFMVWQDALKIISRLVQIQTASPDQLTDGGVIDGSVTFRLWRGADALGSVGELVTLTQREFVEFLRSGKLSEPAAATG